MSKELTPEVSRLLLNKVYTLLVDRLEQGRSPWNQGCDLTSISGLDGSLAKMKTSRHAWKVNNLSRDIRHRVIDQAKPAARVQLKRLGVSFDEASPLFEELCLDILKLETTYWQAQKHRSIGDFSHELIMLEDLKKLGYEHQKESANDVTLLDAWDHYFEEKSDTAPNASWSERTAKYQQATFTEFLEIVGTIPVRQVSRDVVLQYLRVVAKVPKHRTKLYGSTPIKELLALDLDPSVLPTARTVGEKLIQIRAFLKWCKTPMGWIEADPAEGVTVQTESRSYAPFSRDDLSLLFENESYRGNKHRKSWQYWIPLLALYTGARQNELAQLKSTDVQEEDGVPILVITDFGVDQKVKTKAGVRKVPIHPQLLSLGLTQYADALAESGTERLFPDLSKGTNSWAQKVSRWFNDTYKKKCGVTNDATGNRKVFHSFRHTAITQAVGSRLPLQHCQQVFGHEKSLMGETGTYIHQFPLSQTKPVIEALDFGLDHSEHADYWKEFT